ncbi:MULTISPECIES: type VII secretion integral membrane protein EccD [unclassified Streptomyces]|uniref:type VII secretion integral membrane protein EccD n=1 Tax=unclassified Streptomyces TaxID=2593676 RepID=UPI00081EFBC8|nr:type VII secretion integral membrane protein EccD [Streptomyces sp. LcepLS]MYR30115.1 type VII secretion integral membrane protein EccD [Streptomyces sp. SID4945]SCF48751.1 type VII secretion integral membrane protein EccD [Streptomyces sp. LcepLS]
MSGTGALSRVTLVGERRRADLVLPAGEPVGVLLPEILRVLDDRVGERPEVRQLITVEGEALAQDVTLEGAGIADGAVLRLVRAEDAPSAPVVHDVSDEAAADLEVRAWRWGPGARRFAAGLAGTGWALAAGIVARGEAALGTVAGVLLVAAVLCLAAAPLLRSRTAPAAALAGAGGALAVLAAWTYADAGDWGGAARLAGVAGAVSLALLLAAWCTPLGRGALFGAGALGALLLVWEAVLATGGTVRAGALAAVVGVVLLGVLPRLALMASGLTALDDRRAAGSSVSRHRVGAALAATHRGLSLATGVLAVSTAGAGVVLLREVSVWTVSLAAATALALALRARAFPLAAQVTALLAGSAAVVLALLLTWREHAQAQGALAVLVVLAAACLAVLFVEPAEHVRVRVRQAGDSLESLAVVALLPLLLGEFGVYARLLDTFS